MLVIVPINLIIVGQIGLLTAEGLHQTGQDGSSMFTVYIMIAICTILLFSPLVPILHRFTWHIPMFLFLVLIGTVLVGYSYSMYRTFSDRLRPGAMAGQFDPAPAEVEERIAQVAAADFEQPDGCGAAVEVAACG